MATHTVSLNEAASTPHEALLVDEVANEVYSSHYAERKASRFIIGAQTATILGCLFAIVSLAHTPMQNRYIRIDEMGRAQAIQYTDLNYSPREGEVRTYLTDWANYRYTISKDTVSKKYPLNYYFLSQQLSTQLMSEDNASHKISQVMGGQIEQSDVDVRNVTITSIAEETLQGVRISKGTALVNIDKLYSPRNSHDPRTEHWMLSITYYLNPKQVSEQARFFPQFETINPLGMTITEFHENRVGVDPIGDTPKTAQPIGATVIPGTMTNPTLPTPATAGLR
jgi:type IV secretion system protein VirB5